MARRFHLVSEGPPPHRFGSDLGRGGGGFTISELVLVLAVLAGLVAAITWGIRGMDDESAVRDCRTELRTLKAATEQYHAQLGRYPADDGALDEAGILGPSKTPHWRVVTTDQASGPRYVAVGSRCA